MCYCACMFVIESCNNCAIFLMLVYWAVWRLGAGSGSVSVYNVEALLQVRLLWVAQVFFCVYREYCWLGTGSISVYNVGTKSTPLIRHVACTTQELSKWKVETADCTCSRRSTYTRVTRRHTLTHHACGLQHTRRSYANGNWRLQTVLWLKKKHPHREHARTLQRGRSRCHKKCTHATHMLPAQTHRSSESGR